MCCFFGRVAIVDLPPCGGSAVLLFKKVICRSIRGSGRIDDLPANMLTVDS